MTDATVGALRYLPGSPRGRWGIKAQPHVMIRAQRVFPQARSSRGVLVITDSEEAARDIEWFLDRYPLRMDDATRQHLTGQTTLFRDRQTAIRNILQGGRIEDLRDPARPARPYQQTAADLAITTGQLLVADEVGLGKSMTGTLVFRAPEALPGVVVCPTHLTAQWVDEIAKTAIGASGFTDWWAFKIEVQDAIPQAFNIMREQMPAPLKALNGQPYQRAAAPDCAARLGPGAPRRGWGRRSKG